MTKHMSKNLKLTGGAEAGVSGASTRLFRAEVSFAAALFSVLRACQAGTAGPGLSTVAAAGSLLDLAT